jgi:predicted nucleic acid-binding protein
MKQEFYLDTSIFGALTDPGPEFRVRSTRVLFEKIQSGGIKGVISDVLLEELALAPPAIKNHIEPFIKLASVIRETAESLRLAEAYITSGALPAKSFSDARHIAVATCHGVPTIISWNFHHMVNFARKRRINAVNLIQGYPTLEIISPLEVEYETT